MSKRFIITTLFVVAGLAIFAACTTKDVTPPATDYDPQGSISEGGRLYDKWWSESGMDAPSGDQPMWASQTTNTRSGADSWRCKECHGWDYMGAEGVYGSGSHYTGFVGVFGNQQLSVADLLAWLDGTNNAEHDFSAMGDAALDSLVLFLRDGLVDVSSHIDPETKAAIGGDIDNGELLYSSTCSACHGVDGTLINFGGMDDPEYVGTIAVDNPWEFIHKIRFGQPGETMPSAFDSGWTMQDIIDLLTYAQSLVTE
jgi:mono/diheme cytochrome c family protein